MSRCKGFQLINIQLIRCNSTTNRKVFDINVKINPELMLTPRVLVVGTNLPGLLILITIGYWNTSSKSNRYLHD